jgi:hypothetical protein
MTVCCFGHGQSWIERKLLSVRVDLLDAFDEERVAVEIAPDITDFEADIFVVAVGATISNEHTTWRRLSGIGCSDAFGCVEVARSAETIATFIRRLGNRSQPTNCNQ